MKDTFEMPDMEDLTEQMEDAMAEAQKAMADLPEQMGELQDVMGSLSALMGGMPGQMEALGAAIAGFEEQHADNAASLAGDPDWSLQATIRVGEMLHIVVHAAFDLANVQAAWQSTQGAGFEALVEQTVAANAPDIEEGTMGQIMEQLQKGRSIAVVNDIDVLACRIQGAPGDAAAALQLSPEGNVPLMMDQGGLGFEFAPLLTIRNRWEHANIPTFSPMAAQIMVPLDAFDSGEPFTRTFEVSGQTHAITVELAFQPLN